MRIVALASDIIELGHPTRAVNVDRVSVLEAKARWIELIDKAQCGVATAITRKGKIVAHLIPASESRSRKHNAAVIDRIVAFSKTLEVKRRVNIRKTIEAGR